MEQQSQQPIQEKIENKIPIKTNWKLFATVTLVAVVVSVGGILLLRGTIPASIVQTTPSTSPSPNGPVPSPQPQTLNTSTWQTYRNDEFGFEVRYPNYFTIHMQTLRSFKAKSSHFDWLELTLHPQQLDGFRYINATGSFSFRYNAPQDRWIPLPSDVSQALAPEKKQVDNLVFYVAPIGDAAVSGEKIFLEDPQKRFVIELALYSNKSYRDCISPCPEQKPYSSNETLNQILSTFRFVP
ncbi:MAG: hypothetical protein AAB583_05710 [Patescibacteria group bacterium]